MKNIHRILLAGFVFIFLGVDHSVPLQEGDKVKAGDLIGILLYFKNPEFGTATLHFGVGESGGDICPEPYFTEEARAVILKKLHIWHPGYKICYF